MPPFALKATKGRGRLALRRIVLRARFAGTTEAESLRNERIFLLRAGLHSFQVPERNERTRLLSIVDHLRCLSVPLFWAYQKGWT